MNESRSRENSRSQHPPEALPQMAEAPPLASLVRFRPPDALEFGRRAKTLAKFLEAPLQDAQELLARVYGYAHAHEVRQRLKVDEPAGPFDDRLFEVLAGSWRPADEDVEDAQSAEDDDECAADDTYTCLELLNDAEKVRYMRQARLMRIVREWDREQQGRYREHLDTLVCDMAFFSSPTTHRAAVKKVTDFVQGGKGFTDDGFPFGFRGMLHARYGWMPAFEPDAFAPFPKVYLQESHREAIFDPTAQVELLRRYRAPYLFNAMVKETVPDLPTRLTYMEGFEEDMVSRERAELMQCTFADAVASILSFDEDNAVGILAGKTTGANLAKLYVAIDEPTGPEAAAWSAIRDKDAFREAVARLKLELRVALANELTGDTWNEWAEYLDRPSEGSPAVIESWRGDRFLSILLLPVSTEDSIEHWQVCATLMLRSDAKEGAKENEKAGEKERWTAAGVLTGEFITPAKDGTYADPNELTQEFAYYGDGTLSDVWKLLQGLYFGRAGFADYHEWVNEDFGSSLALLTPWVLPEHRGTEVSKWLLEDFVDAFEESLTQSFDADWRSWADPRIEAYDDEQMDDHFFRDPGVVFIPLPGTGILGYSIWEGENEEATRQIIRSKGQRVGREARRYRWMDPESKKQGIGWRLLDAVKTVRADFILFDPEPAKRETPEEDGD